MAGSIDRWETATTNSPDPGGGTASVVSSQSEGLGSPDGRAARRTCWLGTVMFCLRCASGSGGRTAVEDELGTGGIGALVRREVDERTGHLVRSADASHRNSGDQLVDELRRRLPLARIHLGVDLAGMDRVHADADARELLRGDLGH